MKKDNMDRKNKIRHTDINNEKYWCLEDIAKMGGSKDPAFSLSHWLSQPNTVQFLGFLELQNNSDFNKDEYKVILDKAGLNSFVIHSEDWCVRTHSKTIIRKANLTYASKFVSMKFASWISIEFEFIIYQLFDHAKELSQKGDKDIPFIELLS